MANKPTIYSFCKAGCKWPTVHKADFDKAVPFIEQSTTKLIRFNTYRIYQDLMSTKSTWDFTINVCVTDNSGYTQFVIIQLPEHLRYQDYLDFRLVDFVYNKTSTSKAKAEFYYDINGERKVYKIANENLEMDSFQEIFATVNDATKILLHNIGGVIVSGDVSDDPNTDSGDSGNTDSGNTGGNDEPTDTPATDRLTGTTWTVNDPFVVPNQFHTYAIDLESNGRAFDVLMYMPGEGLYFVNGDTGMDTQVLVYDESTGTINSSYKTFTVTGGAEVTNDNAYKFIKSIATEGTGSESGSGEVTPTYYIVTFNTAGGTSVSSKAVAKGNTVSEPTTYRSGYTFVSWQLNGVDYNFSTPVTSDITLVAKWEEITRYTVTFKDYDGTVLKTQSVEEGKSATAPTNVTREGYVFTGWDKPYVNVTSDLTVIAQYEPVSVNLKGTTWRLNDTVDVSKFYVWDVNFTCGGETYTDLEVDNSTSSVGYGGWVQAYSNSGWSEAKYQYITLIDGVDITDADLIAWLQANAVLGTSYTFKDEGLSAMPTEEGTNEAVVDFVSNDTHYRSMEYYNDGPVEIYYCNEYGQQIAYGDGWNGQTQYQTIIIFDNSPSEWLTWLENNTK